MTEALILFQWDGEAMQPQPRFAKICDEKFTVGEVYRMEVSETRSWQSHRHYFASIQEMWENLPEDQCERFPSPEHLRKWGLIRAGYCDQMHVVADTEENARDIAMVMRKLSTYAVITISINVITVYTAKSQSLKAMGKTEFQKSKEAVLDVLAQIIGTRPAPQDSRVG
jgi:hypothetical protein